MKTSSALFIALCLSLLNTQALARQSAYLNLFTGKFEDSELTTVNPSFNYNTIQKVDKSLINLDYKADFYTGYIPVDSSGSRINYQIFPSNGATDASANFNNSDPLVLWMQGGPGCSDWLGQMTEQGPFTIVNDSHGNQVPQLTSISWNQGYNLLYVDQPVGVGFSPAGKTVTTSTEAALDMETFLIAFFQIFTSLKEN